MVVVTSIYLFNLLCAIVPCDPHFRPPEIQSENEVTSESEFGSRGDERDGRSETDLRDNGRPSPRITLGSGEVEGYFMRSVSGKRFYAFEGIPYAQPPLGSNRFKPPIPVKPWKGVFPALKPGPVCLQLNPLAIYRTIGREDCLTINVYSAQIPVPENSSPGLPVIVWIHGGAFLYGSGALYGPAYVLSKDIILVSFNYRLGVLGFLSTGDEVSPGNNGLKDQRLALKWVYDNIAKFGGDRNRVTLMGHSAGAASSHFHMMANSTQDYFQSAMSLSGTGMNFWALSTRERALGLTNKLAKRMNCPQVNPYVSQTSSETMKCLRRRNPVFLVSNQMNLLDWGPLPIVLFSPVLEPPSQDAFLTQSPRSLYAQNKVAKIPWITSVTKEEGYFHLLFVYAFAKSPELRKKWETLAPILFDYHQNPSNGINELKTTAKIKEYYFGDESPKTQSKHKLSQPISERFFVQGFHQATLEHAKIAPTYSYIFDYKGKYNVGNYLGLDAKEWGVGHAEDIFYIFNSTTLYTGFRTSEVESQISQFMVNILTNFAAKREPFHTNKDGEDVSMWNPVDFRNPRFLSIGQKRIEMIKDPYGAVTKFWDSLNFNDQ